MRSFISIPIQEQHIKSLRDQAHQHLIEHDISVHIDRIQSSDKDLFCVVFRQGDIEQWWNDGLSDSQDDVLVWETKEEAERDLEEYVLPNLALCVSKDRVKQFQMNL